VLLGDSHAAAAHRLRLVRAPQVVEGLPDEQRRLVVLRPRPDRRLVLLDRLLQVAACEGVTGIEVVSLELARVEPNRGPIRGQGVVHERQKVPLGLG
jgi:hypothetical protein